MWKNVVKIQKAISSVLFSRFVSVSIIALENFINKEVPIKSLPTRQHYHIIVSGLRKTGPNHNFPSSNIPSDSSWPGNSGREPHRVPRIIQIKPIFIAGENISEFL
jgi:hypothetical protein